ncbi:MAG: major capsid protein [Desulfurivibrionaceae bacterium]|jgi:hypothetical protein
MTVSIYDTRTMMAAVRQIPPANAWLLRTFFPGKTEFTTKHVDVDIIKGKRKVGAYVSPIKEGRVRIKEGMTTKIFIPPYLKEKEPITPQEFFTREAGNVIYAPGDGPNERAQRELGRILGELDTSYTRAEEVQAASILNDGTVVCTGEGINVQVDFGMPSTHKITLTSTDLWTDTTNSDPLTDLVDWCNLVIKDSGIVPRKAVLGLDVAKAFVNHPKVKDVLNNRRITMGQLDPQAMPEGVTYLGNVSHAGVDLDLYTYQEWYLDANDVEQPMVPADKIWLGSSATANKILYGAIQDLKAGGIAALARFPKSWEQDDPSVRWVMLQSAPLVAMLQPDAFLSAKAV